MGSPAVFDGNFTELLTPKAIMRSDGGIIDYAGTKNYINNNHFEVNLNGWSLFNTTLTNGLPTGSITSGASSLSMLRTSVNPIRGSYSMQISASSGWTAGQGFISDAFTLDEAETAVGSILNSAFRYYVVSGGSSFNWSGTLGSQSLIVAIYDVTNSAWVIPNGYNGMNSSVAQQVLSSLQSNATSGQQYRIAVLASQATTGASTINFDDFSVSPQSEFIGAVVTDLDSYTPTVSTGAFTFSDLKASRTGSGLNLSFEAQSTTVGSGVYEFSLPPGLSFDSTVALSTVTNGVASQSIGTIIGNCTAGSIAGGAGVVVATSSTTFALVLGSAASGPFSGDGNDFTDRGLGFGSASPFNAIGTGCSVQIVNAAITGWSSQMQVNPPVGAPVVAFRASKATANQSLSNNTTTLITFDTVTLDTLGAWNSSSNDYVIGVSGDYEIEGSLCFAANATGERRTFIEVNGTVVATGEVGAAVITSNPTVSCRYIGSLKAGDLVTIYGSQGSGGALNVDYQDTDGNNGTATFFQLKLIPPMVATYNPSIRMRYTDTSGQSVGTSATQLSFATKSFDTTNGSWSGNTFTVAESGIYRVKAAYETFGVTLTTSDRIYLMAYHNGSLYSYLRTVLGNGASSISYSIGGEDEIDCVAGDTISVYGQSDVATNLLSSATNNYIIIEKVG